MPRVLHLIDLASADITARAASSLRDNPGFTFETCTIGRGGGMPDAARAVLALHRRRLDPPPDLTHAFGSAALSVAALGIGGKIVYSPASFPGRQDVRWIRALIAHRDVHVVCQTDTMRRRFVERGVPISRCLIIRPGVELGLVKRRRDPQLRAALGIAPDDLVLLPVGRSTRTASHELAAWAAAMLHVLDPRYRLLLWGEGPHAATVQRFAVRLDQPGMLSMANRLQPAPSFETLLSAADVAMVTATGPVDTAPIATTLAAGLPIISTVTRTVSELLEDRRNALLVAQPTPRLLVRRVMDLMEEPDLGRHIAETARADAYEFFALSRYREQWNALYEKLTAGANRTMAAAATQGGA